MHKSEVLRNFLGTERSSIQCSSNNNPHSRYIFTRCLDEKIKQRDRKRDRKNENNNKKH